MQDRISGRKRWAAGMGAWAGLLALGFLTGVVLLVLPQARALAASPLSWSAPQQVDPEPPAEPIALTGVSCSSASFCAAADDNGNVLTSTNPTSGASAWHSRDINGGRHLFGIACPSDSFCAALGVSELGGGGVLTSTDPTGADPWKTAGGVWQDEAITCPSSLFCAASGFGDISTSTNPTSGEAWNETTVGNFMPDISCSSPSFCAAGDWNQNVYTSTNPTGGPTAWHGADLEASSLNAISCPSRSFCVVGTVSNSIWVSTNPTGNSEAWQPAVGIGPNNGLGITGISCPTVSFCVAVDDTGSLIESADPTGGAEAWTVVAADPTHSFTGISCPTASLCVAVDNAGNVLTGTGAPIAQHTLTTSKTGEGSGAVVSSPASGIECGSTCSRVFDDGTPVTLTATPAKGSTFAGWTSGGCSGIEACEVTISSNIEITASFTKNSPLQHTLSVTRSGSGTGLVSSSPTGIDCGGTCAHSYEDGTPVTLTASPAAGSTFAGWTGGACSGTGTCELSLASDVEVTATFTANDGGDSGNSPDGGGSADPAPPPAPAPSPHKKPLECRKGFKKRKVHGQVRCVRKHRHHASASASTATETNSTKQECLSQLLQPPHDITAAMLNPHKAEIFIEAFYDAVEGCDSWKRLGKFRVQLKQRGQWRDLNGNFWYPTDSDKGAKNEAHGFCFLDFETHDGVREEREHGHWQPARVRFINFVTNAKTGKVVAHGTIKDQPVTLGYNGPC